MHRTTMGLAFALLLVPLAYAADNEPTYTLTEDDAAGDVGVRVGEGASTPAGLGVLDLLGFSLGHDDDGLLFQFTVGDLRSTTPLADGASYHVHWLDDAPMRLTVTRIVPVDGSEPKYTWSLYQAQDGPVAPVYLSLAQFEDAEADPEAGLVRAHVPFEVLPGGSTPHLERLYLTTGPFHESIATAPGLVGPSSIPYVGDRLPNEGVLDFRVEPPTSDVPPVAPGAPQASGTEPVASLDAPAASLGALGFAVVGLVAAFVGTGLAWRALRSTTA